LCIRIDPCRGGEGDAAILHCRDGRARDRGGNRTTTTASTHFCSEIFLFVRFLQDTNIFFFSFRFISMMRGEKKKKRKKYRHRLFFIYSLFIACRTLGSTSMTPNKVYK